MREKSGVFLPVERYDEMCARLALQNGNITELESLLGVHQVCGDHVVGTSS
jgi:hypothetical protein